MLTVSEYLSICFPNTVSVTDLIVLDLQELIAIGEVEVNEDYYYPSVYAKRTKKRVQYSLVQKTDQFPDALGLNAIRDILRHRNPYMSHRIAKELREKKGLPTYRKDILSALVNRGYLKKQWWGFVDIYKRTLLGKEIQGKVFNMVQFAENNEEQLNDPNEFIKFMNQYGLMANLLNFIYLNKKTSWRHLFRNVKENLIENASMYQAFSSPTFDLLTYALISDYSIQTYSTDSSFSGFDFGGGDFSGGGASGDW